MRWFLELFPAYRRMVSDLQEASTRLLQLQDRVDAAESERARVWSLVEGALRGKDQAQQMCINEFWQTRYGLCPYPEAPHIPTNMVPPAQPGGPIPIGRAMPGQAVEAARRTFTREYLGRAGVKPEPAPIA